MAISGNTRCSELNSRTDQSQRLSQTYSGFLIKELVRATSWFSTQNPETAESGGTRTKRGPTSSTGASIGRSGGRKSIQQCSCVSPIGTPTIPKIARTARRPAPMKPPVGNRQSRPETPTRRKTPRSHRPPLPPDIPTSASKIASATFRLGSCWPARYLSRARASIPERRETSAIDTPWSLRCMNSASSPRS